MILNLDQVIKKIRIDECVTAYLWEGHVNKTDEQNVFHKIHSADTATLIDDLSLFVSDFPGKYTVIAKKHSSDKHSTGFMYRCDLSIPQSYSNQSGQQLFNKQGQLIMNGNVQNNPQPNNLTAQDIQKIHQEAFEKAKAEMLYQLQLHTITAERDFYKIDAERMKQPAHKFGYLLEWGIERLFAKGTGIDLKTTTTMNGSNNAGGFANIGNLMNGKAKEADPQQLTAEQQTELENSLGEIIKQVGIANINKLAASMKVNPSIGQMIKLQIESSK